MRMTHFRIIAQDQHGNMLIMKRNPIAYNKEYWLKHRNGKIERTQRVLVKYALRGVKPLFIHRSNTRAFAFHYETNEFPLAQGAGLKVNPWLVSAVRKSEGVYSLVGVEVLNG